MANKRHLRRNSDPDIIERLYSNRKRLEFEQAKDVIKDNLKKRECEYNFMSVPKLVSRGHPLRCSYCCDTVNSEDVGRHKIECLIKSASIYMSTEAPTPFQRLASERCTLAGADKDAYDKQRKI